jgi:hypothetical protein
MPKPPPSAIEAIELCLPSMLTLAESPFGVHVGPFRQSLDALIEEVVKKPD